MIAVFLLVSWLSSASAQHQALIDYLEQRLIAIESRISFYQEESSRCAADLRDFKQQVVFQLEGIDKEKEMLRTDFDSVKTRVDRIEREMDYMETQNGAQACVDVDDKLVEQDVTTAKEKNKSKYAKLTDCRDMISSIKAMKILKREGSAKGVWTKDIHGSQKVYVFNGTDKNTLAEYKTVLEFTSSSGSAKAKRYTLPSNWAGTGHTVYKGHVYYVKEGKEFQLVKYNLENSSVVDRSVFPAEDQVPVYTLNPDTYIELAADEEGLWAIYATRESEKNICLAKIDPKTLDIEQMWDTPCPRESAEAAFVVCGTMYVVYNTKLPSRSRVQCVFDVSDTVSSDDASFFYFPKRYGSHSSLKYNPAEQLIYGWDDGYQILYKLNMKQKLEV